MGGGSRKCLNGRQFTEAGDELQSLRLSHVLVVELNGMAAIRKDLQTSCANALPARGRLSPRRTGRITGRFLDTIESEGT